MGGKEALREVFSKDPGRYYEVELFRGEGFARKRCPSCGKYFWTLDAGRERCSDQPCEPYQFLGDPPTAKRLDYVAAWREVEAFFTGRGHTSVGRYPVVCRWRPDLYFTVASIVDFQRVEGGKVVFELPVNPLIVPQMCLRFNDLTHVGLSGKHYTCFCMVGQHAIDKDGGYWKDRCIELDFEFLTKALGIKREEVVFIEDVWLGYGAFGYSLEYFARGLELGNAVFTEFEGSPENYRVMKEKVVDMGAGLERFTWITQGTGLSYEAVFGPVMKKLVDATGIDYPEDLLLAYGRRAGLLDWESILEPAQVYEKVAGDLKKEPAQLKAALEPLQVLYALADHVRAIVFAVADGAIPSNVAGGYNLRVLLRRAQGFLERYGWPITLEAVADWHIDFLKPIFPELAEHRDEVRLILEVEREKYRRTVARVGKIVEDMARKKKGVSLEEMVRLYESEGVTPELLRARGLVAEIPADFYGKVTAHHERPKFDGEATTLSVEGLSPTRLVFYEDRDRFEFQARVLKVLDGGHVVLDVTSFYPEGGGQVADTGFIDGARVVDVQKYGDVVVHTLERPTALREREVVKCTVDGHRRYHVMRHHTATHIMNGAARHVLGPWIWQHSAYKSPEYARLDITHYAHLTPDLVARIEQEANRIIQANIPVDVAWLPRGEAEDRYGFRLYQGGIYPGREVRVVRIGDYDIEACGGTHCSRTGDVGFIKVVKVERIQDGVERLEYVAGDAAVKYLQEREAILQRVAEMLETAPEHMAPVAEAIKASYDQLRTRYKAAAKKFGSAFKKIQGVEKVGGLRLYIMKDEALDEEYHVAAGEEAVKADPSLVYVAFVKEKEAARVTVFAGKRAVEMGVKAGELAELAAKTLGGSGGGGAKFGQGGGKKVEKMSAAEDAVRSRLLSALKRS